MLFNFLLTKIILVRPLTRLHLDARPLVGKHPLVKVQPLIPIPHGPLAGYFSWAILWEMMASMSAKPTQFGFPLCRSFLAISSKFYIVVSML